MNDIYKALSNIEDLVEKCIEDTVSGGLEDVDVQCSISNLYKIQYINTMLYRYANGGVFDSSTTNSNILDVIRDAKSAAYVVGAHINNGLAMNLFDAIYTADEVIKRKMDNG